MREQREGAERVPKTAGEEDKRPMRKPDILDAGFVVREKRKGTSDKTVAGMLKVCIRQA